MPAKFCKNIWLARRWLVKQEMQERENDFFFFWKKRENGFERTERELLCWWAASLNRRELARNQWREDKYVHSCAWLKCFEHARAAYRTACRFNVCMRKCGSHACVFCLFVRKSGRSLSNRCRKWLRWQNPVVHHLLRLINAVNSKS